MPRALALCVCLGLAALARAEEPAKPMPPFFDPAAPAPTVDPTLPTKEPTPTLPDKKEKKPEQAPKKKDKKPGA